MVIQNPIELVNTYPQVSLTVDCVIFGFNDNALQVLLIQSDLDQFKDQLSLFSTI